MRARRTRLVVAVLLALLVAVPMVLGPAEAQTDKERKEAVDAQIAELRTQLGDTSAQLAEATLALRRAQLQLPAAQQAVDAAEAELARAQRRDAELAARLALAEAEERKAARQLERVGAQIRAEEDSIGALANAAYRQGGMGELAVALQAEDPDDLTDRLVMVETVVTTGNLAVARLGVARAQARNVRAVLTSKREQVAAMRAQAQQVVRDKQRLSEAAQRARDEVAQLIQQRAAAAQAVEREKVAESRRLAAAQAESRRLAEQIAAEAARLAAQRSSRSSGRTALVPSGSLLFPTSGSISQYAGYRRHPVTGSASCHSGIDIAAGSGTPIRAADDGVVVATTYTSWDGNVTIVDHGDGLTTWYAHQSSFGVSPGQSVTRGQVIGAVGSTGLSTGPHLHFNVAINGVAYDPMGWFGGSKRTVASLCPSGPAPVL